MPINKVLYFGDFFVLPVALAIFAFVGLAGHGLTAAAEYLAALAAGVVAWTFSEYWIHRTFYHHAPWLSELHARHHREPGAYIGAPSFLSCGLVVLLSYGPFVFIAPVFAAGFASGALVGYAAYMLVHHATHHWTIEPGDWLYPARVRHMAHHYHDDSDFGIVTGFWDRAFGTAGRRRRRLAQA